MSTREDFINAVTDAANNTSFEKRMVNLFKLSLGENRDFSLFDGAGILPIPNMEFAVKTLSERAGVLYTKAAKLAREDREAFMEICNKLFSVTESKEEAWVYSYNGKLIATHSGSYRPLAIDHLAHSFVSEIEARFPKAIFRDYLIDEYGLYANYSLEEYPELVQRYAELAGKCMVAPSKIKPLITFTTSNAGLSGANLSIYFEGAGNVNFPALPPLKLEHKGSADEAKFAENCMGVYSQFDLALDGLEKLAEQRITNTQECLLNAAKRVALPKKHTIEVVEKYNILLCGRPVSALDGYIILSEVVNLVPEERKMAVNELLCRLLTFDWSEFDHVTCPWLKD